MALPQIQETLDTLYTTTWQLMREESIDNIFKTTPFWFYMTEGGRKTTEAGGRWIGIPLEYGDHRDTIAWIGKSHDLSTENAAAKDKEILTTAQYNWRYVAASVYRSWQDDTQNRGKSAMQKIIDVKLKNVETSLAEEMEYRLFQAGDPTDDTIEGLPHLVQDDPTANLLGAGLVGGIDQSTETWWRNQAYDMTAETVVATLVPRMRTMFNDCSKGQDMPEILLTTQAIYELYEDEVMDFMTIMKESGTKGDASFESIIFKGRPLMYSDECPIGKMYQLNLKYLEWVADENVNFEMTEWKTGRADLDRVAQILCAGNLVCSNRARQGVIFGIGQI